MNLPAISTINPAFLFYGMLVLALLVIRIPFVGIYLRTVNTLLHESGHALMALLLSGEVTEVKLHSNTSGSALTKTNSKAKSLLVSFVGYPFAALMILILFGLLEHDQIRVGYFILISISLIHLAFFVRNGFGMIWLLGFSGLIFATIWYANDSFSRMLFIGLLIIAFAETISSTFIIIYLGLWHPKKAGDLTNLARLSKIPAAFWALLLCGVCFVIFWFTIEGYFPPLKQLLNGFYVNS